MIQYDSSFRDPSGCIFTKEGKFYRKIFPPYFKEFDHVEESGLYKDLTEKELLVPHKLIERSAESITIMPETIPFISYPSEWSFEALKEASLLHMKINTMAMNFGMILKDASAYNVQFVGSRPIFIDTLSFSFYKDGYPWDAFGQFCRHFIAPLLLMKYRSLDFNKILTSFLDGIPLEMASELLPKRTHFNVFIKTNIHLHSRIIRKNQDASVRKTIKLSRKKLLNIFDYTYSFLSDLKYSNKLSEWGNYYDSTNYTSRAFEEKNNTILSWLNEIRAHKIWDAGGNDGYFSRKVSSGREIIITSDIDPIAVDRSFVLNKDSRAPKNILSLLVDLTNPTPSFGFENKERISFLERIREFSLDCSLALALIHHLSISNNCSFGMISKMFSSVSKYLIIEFVDRKDPHCARVLENMGEKKHLFNFYNKDNFEKDFERVFFLRRVERIPGHFRTLYLMESKMASTPSLS